MKRNRLFLGIVVLLLCVIAGCSTKKNTPMNRRYHAFTAHYNTYFNGKMAFDQALYDQLYREEENYTERITMFPISKLPKEKSLVGGPFDRAIEKGDKAIKEHSIRKKPMRKANWRSDPKQLALQDKEEYNPFLKHAWLMIGQSQFYNTDFLQAAATFSYIMRHYATEPEVVTEARIWQAECYAEMNWLYEAESLFDLMKERGIPEANTKLYDRVYADYLIKREMFEEAIPYLIKAIKTEKNKRQRLRMRYLLGQLYTEVGQQDAAYATFGKVARANPPYSLEFAARIRQAEVFPGGDYQATLRRLNRMAKHPKNKEFLDQVYYAIGNVYMSRQDTTHAIENYAKGIEKSTQNGLNKAICQIRLGDIYFQQRDYVQAQPCFSGALAGIQKEYHEYERVSQLSSILDQLVVHVEAVHLQDSLQVLAKMPESERLALIDGIIEEVKKKAEEEQALLDKEAYLVDQGSMGSDDQRASMGTTPAMMPGSSEYAFYFYNPQVVEQGKKAFQTKWGKRPLEDHWRRRNKVMEQFASLEEKQPDEERSLEFDEEGNPMQSVDSLQLVMDSLASDPLSREYYLQQIPFSEEDLEASNIIVADGLFNMGMIYKDRLENMELSLEVFEKLESRFPENKYRLDYYYQIYLMALRHHDQPLAEVYKKKLMNAFPASDYAAAVADPHYLERMRTMDAVQDSLYEQTYHLYLASDTAAVRHHFTTFMKEYPLGKLIPKFMFLNALTYVQAGDPDGFKVALDSLVSKYPQADVSALATEMLKGLLRGRTLVQGDFSGISWNLRFGLSDGGMLLAEDSARQFTVDSLMPHQLLLIYKTGSIAQNQLLFVVAAYNFAHLTVESFDLALEGMGDLSMLKVSGFRGVEELSDYYRKIYEPEGYAKSVDHAVAFFPISTANLETLMRGKTLEEYMLFFEEHLSEQFPGVLERWILRVEEAQLEDTVQQTTSDQELLLDDEQLATEEEVEEHQEERLEYAERDTLTLLERSHDTLTLAVDTLVEVLELQSVDTVPPPAQEISLKELKARTKQLKQEEKKRKQEEEKALKARNKAKDKERKEKAKAREEAKKEKARDAKERMKQKGKVRKEKTKETKQRKNEPVVNTAVEEVLPTEAAPQAEPEVTMKTLKTRTKAIQSEEKKRKQEEQKALKKQEKAKEDERKQKAKERDEVRKQKAHEAKERQKEKVRASKAKEKEYKQRQKEKSAARKKKS